jgi:hypothetical protein
MQNHYGKTNQMPIKRQAKTARIAAATLSYKKKRGAEQHPRTCKN